MTLNIPGLNKLKKKDSKKTNNKKFTLSNDKFKERFIIFKSKLISLINGKTLIRELILLNKKIIIIMFLAGLFINAVIPIISNYNDLQKKLKSQEVSLKNFDIWKKKIDEKNKDFSKLDSLYKNKIRGKYNLQELKDERMLLNIFINKVNKSSSNYIHLKFRSFVEDVSSNTLKGTMDVTFKRLIMRPILVNSLQENGYFVEELGYDKIKIRKIKDN
ncbi:MAG: hypothetical protein DRG78_02400 [Epsilonproteobacteria bacterium]|nr:MAG: hypothetical protein DRG78_02400 [Campylobacterota bacterium]